jgi:RNA polymerase-binding transcription factor DksA
MNGDKPSDTKGYGFCGKCGKHLTPKELRYGSTMCDDCMEKARQDYLDSQGWI